jgi:hypothetical protein
MALQGISNFCGLENQGGLIRIDYVPTAWVDADAWEPIVSAAWNWQYDVQFTSGGWLTALVLPTRQLWDERQGRGDQGRYYDQAVKAVAPGLRPDVAKEFDEMAQYRFLLRLWDQNNQPWLLGTLETPFDFSADGSSGETGGLANHAIRWESRTPRKAVGFVPVF